MAAFNPKAYRFAAETYNLLVKYIANAAQGVKAQVLPAFFNPVYGALGSTEAPGKLSLC